MCKKKWIVPLTGTNEEPIDAFYRKALVNDRKEIAATDQQCIGALDDTQSDQI